MKSAGCYAVSFGIESGNPNMLKRIRKGISLNQAINAVQCCKRAGIRTHASFMVGLPGETMQTLNDSLSFAESLDIEYGFHFLAPFPGTTLRENIQEYDLEILTHDWNKYDANQAIVRTSALSPEDIDNFVANWSKGQEDLWNDLLQTYKQGGELHAKDKAAVEESYKRQFIFWLLSEDLIEKMGRVKEQTNNALDSLSIRIASYVSKRESVMTPHFVKKHLTELIEKHFIVCVTDNSENIWKWT